MTCLICVQIKSNLKQGSISIIQKKIILKVSTYFLAAEDLFGLFLCQDPLTLEGLTLPEILWPL